MPPLLWLWLGALIVLIGLSVRLANSGFFAGREDVGWILFGGVLILYISFVAAWYRATGEVTGWEALYIIFLAVLILPLGVLGAELVTLTFMPDPSKGLKYLRAHTEAEKKVAQDNLPGAIEEYENLIAKDPNDIPARMRMAELCSEIEDFEKAAKAYEGTLKKAHLLGVDRHCSVLTRLSEIYARNLGEPERARELVRVIVDKYPDTEYAAFARERLENL